MKKFKIALTLLPILGISCSEENVGTFGTEDVTVVMNRSVADIAQNAANPYDGAGRLYDSIVEIASNGKFAAQTVGEVATLVDSIVAMHPEWGLSSGGALSANVPHILGWVNSTTPIEEALAASSLGIAAQNRLLEFRDSIAKSEHEPYEDFYFITVAYESIIWANVTYTHEEKKSLLMAASIARYAESRKRRKDKDWETSVSIAAAVSGNGDFSLAVRMAAVAAICKRQGISN